MIAKFSRDANGVIYHFSVRHKLGQFVGAIITTFAIEMVAVGIILAFNRFIPKTDLSEKLLGVLGFLAIAASIGFILYVNFTSESKKYTLFNPRPTFTDGFIDHMKIYGEFFVR